MTTLRQMLRESEVIKEFMHNYSPEHWVGLAACAQALIKKTLLGPYGDPKEGLTYDDVLKHRVTCRGKDRHSLRNKLIQRDGLRSVTERYRTSQEIADDIVDLAGVRIILYMPSNKQHEIVKEMLEKIWPKMLETKEHKGPTYEAIHYRIKLKGPMPNPTNVNYVYRKGDRFEIQVISAFAHACAEATHDVKYKTGFYGKLNRREERILETLHGLVKSGDLLFEAFYDELSKRTRDPFQHLGQLTVHIRELDLVCESPRPNIFDGQELRQFFNYLMDNDNARPRPVRRALSILGFPDQADFKPTLAMFKPEFTPAKAQQAAVALIKALDTEQGLLNQAFVTTNENDPPEELSIMQKFVRLMKSLHLLQTFAGSPQLARTFFQGCELSDGQLHSINKVLKGPRRQCFLGVTLLAGQPYKMTMEDEQAVKSDIDPAWSWFLGEAHQPHSICGLCFRIASIKKPSPAVRRDILDQLSIGTITRRDTASTTDSAQSGPITPPSSTRDSRVLNIGAPLDKYYTTEELHPQILD